VDNWAFGVAGNGALQAVTMERADQVASSITGGMGSCSATQSLGLGRAEPGLVHPRATTAPPQNCGSSASPTAGATHAKFTAGLLDRMTASTEAIDWWERDPTATTPMITTVRGSLCGAAAFTDRGHSS
jgi:hypothetical protein